MPCASRSQAIGTAAAGHSQFNDLADPDRSRRYTAKIIRAAGLNLLLCSNQCAVAASEVAILLLFDPNQKRIPLRWGTIYTYCAGT